MQHWYHFELICISLWFLVYLTLVSLRFHSDLTPISRWSHFYFFLTTLLYHFDLTFRFHVREKAKLTNSKGEGKTYRRPDGKGNAQNSTVGPDLNLPQAARAPTHDTKRFPGWYHPPPPPQPPIGMILGFQKNIIAPRLHPILSLVIHNCPKQSHVLRNICEILQNYIACNMLKVATKPIFANWRRVDPSSMCTYRCDPNFHTLIRRTTKCEGASETRFVYVWISKLHLGSDQCECVCKL